MPHSPAHHSLYLSLPTRSKNEANRCQRATEFHSKEEEEHACRRATSVAAVRPLPRLLILSRSGCRTADGVFHSDRLGRRARFCRRRPPPPPQSKPDLISRTRSVGDGDVGRGRAGGNFTAALSLSFPAFLRKQHSGRTESAGEASLVQSNSSSPTATVPGAVGVGSLLTQPFLPS